jgi:hypothetical protein
MAGDHGTTSDFQEIIHRIDLLKAPEHASPPVIPLIDPTANVLSLVRAETKRQDDLRCAESKTIRDMLSERRQTDSDAKKAEADRIDALLSANKNDVALALSKQQAQAEAQDKRIAILEQNQYQGAGRQGQQTENRQHSQWLIGLAITMALGLGALIVKVLFK